MTYGLILINEKSTKCVCIYVTCLTMVLFSTLKILVTNNLNFIIKNVEITYIKPFKYKSRVSL